MTGSLMHSSTQTTQIESHIERLLEERREDGEESHISYKLQPNPSSQATQIQQRIQKWLEEAAQLSCSLQAVSSSQMKDIGLYIQKWLREQKAGEAALLTYLLESILSPQNREMMPRDQERPKSKVTKASEQKASASQKKAEEYIVRADNNTDAKALHDASLSMPEARLVIRSRYVSIEELLKVYAIRLPRRALNFEDIFGVVQSTEHTEFMLEADLRFDTHRKSFKFRCEVVYDPETDDCMVFNHSSMMRLYLSRPGNLFMQRQIEPRRKEFISPGAWTISIKKQETPGFLYPIVEILILQRRFSISTDRENDPSQSGRFIEDPTPLIKRQKLDNGKGIVRASNLFPRESLQRLYLQADQYAPQDANTTSTSILDLADGETACIQSLHANKKKRKDTYQLRRIAEIASLPATSVFSCRHSKLGEMKLVIKIPRFDKRYDRKELLVRFKEGWKREKELLESLRHKNIVSLKAFDSRFFALYLEHLPPSLDKTPQSHFNISNARSILHNLSSALTYLSTQGIIHFDIKLQNITYSRSRGAVLIDFNLAQSVNVLRKDSGGTPAYLPPEFNKPEETRGFPGDIWALGVTALWLLGKITDPSKEINDRSPSTLHSWLQRIYLERDQLDLANEVEGLVIKMLQEDSKARIKAVDIERALKGNNKRKRN